MAYQNYQTSYPYPDSTQHAPVDTNAHYAHADPFQHPPPVPQAQQHHAFYAGYQQQQQPQQQQLQQQPQAFYHTLNYSATPAATANTGSYTPSVPSSTTPVSLQPEAQKPMVLTTWNPTSMALDSKGEREWSHSLCSCCDEPATCCLAWMFPCLIYGENKSRQTYLQKHSRPHPEGGEVCGSNTWIFCLSQTIGISPIIQCLSRGSTRERYRISGNGCTDCLASCFCLPCNLTQQNREIEEEENMLIRHQYGLQ